MTNWRKLLRLSRFTGRRDDDDRGAVLILALLFVVAVGLVATALATWATNDLNNAKTFTSVEALHSDASGMMKMSVQYVRYNPVISAGQAANVASPVVACWGGSDVTTLPTIDGDQVAVWCSTVWNPGLGATRVVTFYACSATVPASVCTSPGKTLLTEVVSFDDYPPGVNAPNETLCSLSCGVGMTVSNSTWGPSTIDVQDITPASASFIVEPSTTLVNESTTAQVKILGAGGLPISGASVTLTALSPGFLSSSSSLSEITNVTGVADFNYIVPITAGTVILQATYAGVSATSTGFTVVKGANLITVNAGTPSNPSVNSVVTLSPSPAAIATSGDAVTITGTSGICTASGNAISMVAVGTCVLTFTDVGNANYAAATPVTMSFSVVPVPATALAISSSSSSLSASNVTNDTLTLTLLASNGSPTTSNGTTTVSLSQNGSGFFASTLGSGPATTSVTFANGVGTATAYFGDQGATGAVRVTATSTPSAGLTSASTTLQIVAAAASQIVVNASTPVLASSKSNDAVSLTIEDQYGNVVSPSIPTKVSLSSSSTTGLFAISSGSATPIASVTWSAGIGTGTVYFGDPKAEAVTLTATESAGVAGSTSVTVNPSAAATVVISTSTPVLTSTNSNDPVTISLLDQFGNTVVPSVDTAVTLASTSSGYFTAVEGNNTTETATKIRAGQSSVTVYFGDAIAANPATITVTVGTIVATSQIVATVPTPSQIGISANSPVATSSRTGNDPVTLTLEDSSGNPINATASTTVALNSTAGNFFGTTNSRTQITQVTIPKGSSSITAYFGDSTASSNVKLTATSSGLTTGTTYVTVN